jgi:hypothetical protein
MVLASLLAIALWAALLAHMNLNPVTTTNQAIFLGIWAAAFFLTVMPISYALHARLTASLGRAGDLGRAVRQGFLVAVLATILMSLRFLYILTLFTAAVLGLIVLLVELLFALRRA